MSHNAKIEYTKNEFHPRGSLPTIQSLVATRVLAHAQSRSDKFSIDPFTIFTICNCIISLVRLLYMCYSKERIIYAIKKDSLVHRVLLRREVRKKFKNPEKRRALYKSFSEVSQALSQKEVTELVESITPEEEK